MMKEKASEIEVLKEMIKSTNTQLKAREKDQIRLKSKVVHLEGKSLAARQLQSPLTGSLHSGVLQHV